MNRTTTLALLLIIPLLAGVIYMAWAGSRQASVLVEWETASELDTAGFNLYRSLDPEGPFLQVNNELIPTAGDPLSGGRYSYEDGAVQPGRMAYYQLEEVQLDGSSQRFGPIAVQAERWVPPLAVPAATAVVLAAFLWLVWRRKSHPLGDRAAGKTAGEEQV